MDEETKEVKTLPVWVNSQVNCACNWMMNTEWKGGKMVACCFNEKCSRRGILVIVPPLQATVAVSDAP